MDRKQLKKEYARAKRTMGVYQVRNLLNGKLFIGSGLDVEGAVNSCRFQLLGGLHMNRALQRDFNELGVERFAFEVIDCLAPSEDGEADDPAGLRTLEAMWKERLAPFDEHGYNER